MPYDNNGWFDIKRSTVKWESGFRGLSMETWESYTIAYSPGSQQVHRYATHFISLAYAFIITFYIEHDADHLRQDSVRSTSGDPASSHTHPTHALPHSPYADPSPYSYEWFQSDEFVIISIFIKNVPKDGVDIDFHERSVCIILVVGDGGDGGGGSNDSSHPPPALRAYSTARWRGPVGCLVQLGIGPVGTWSDSRAMYRLRDEDQSGTQVEEVRTGSQVERSRRRRGVILLLHHDATSRDHGGNQHQRR